MSIVFECPSCSKKFQVKDELAGNVAKCVSCGNKIRISVPAATTASAEVSSRLDDLLDDVAIPSNTSEDTSLLAETPELGLDPAVLEQFLFEEQRNLEKEKSTTKPTCPSCGKLFVVSTVVCVNCGYDAKAGTSIVEKSQSQSLGFTFFSFLRRLWK